MYLNLCVAYVQLLVEKGADVNRPFGTASLPAVPFKHLVTQCPTALHLACDRGDIELVKVCYPEPLSATVFDLGTFNECVRRGAAWYLGCQTCQVSV